MLYQQGTQRIEVVVRKEGGTADIGAKEKNPEDVGGESESGKRGGLWAKLTGSESIARQERVVKTNTTHLIATMMQIGLQSRTYFLTGTGMRSGDQALQQNVMREWEIFRDTSGFASSVAMGALYGSWGGPIGTVLGTLFGAATTGTSTAIKYAQRTREFNFKRFKEDNAIEYKRARANINLTTGRLR